MDERRRRIAEHEVRFRDINERLHEGIVGVVEADELIDFLCECGAADCRDGLRVTLGEYEAVRSSSRQFAVVPGHEIPDVEDVIRREDRFVVVRKHEDTTAIVAAADPRD
jgi:hypothetical protein